MNFQRYYKHITILKLLEGCLSSYGAVWLVVEIANFFGSSKLQKMLQGNLIAFLIIGILGVIIVIMLNLPKLKYSYTLNERDVIIEVVVADVFNLDGSIVIPMNNQFDTFLGGNVTGTNSVQSRLISDY